MRCIIVDDEPLAIEGMKLNLAEVKDLVLSGSFHTAASANDFLQSNPVDLMFLDINMPGMTGLELLRALRNPPLVILTTAYPQFALESYELDVVDYLVKPVRLERLLKAVNKARDLHRLMQEPKNPPAEAHEDHLFIRSERKFVKINFSDLLFVQGLKDYVVLHTPDQKIMTAMNVKNMHAKLPQEQFARISKSYIVNIRQITAFDNETVYIGAEELPIGKTFREGFREEYVQKYLLD